MTRILGWGCAIGVPPTSRLELQVRRLHKPLRPSGFGKAQTVPKSGRVWWFKVSWVVVEPTPRGKKCWSVATGIIHVWNHEGTSEPNFGGPEGILFGLTSLRGSVLLVRHCRDTSKCLACFKSLRAYTPVGQNWGIPKWMVPCSRSIGPHYSKATKICRLLGLKFWPILTTPHSSIWSFRSKICYTTLQPGVWRILQPSLPPGPSLPSWSYSKLGRIHCNL